MLAGKPRMTDLHGFNPGFKPLEEAPEPTFKAES